MHIQAGSINNMNAQADTLRVDMSAELTSYVGIQLNNPVMQVSTFLKCINFYGESYSEYLIFECLRKCTKKKFS